MADTGNYGDAAGEDGAGDLLGVETPEVFQGAAPSGDDDDVDDTLIVERTDGLGDLFGGEVALNGGGGQAQLGQGVATHDDILDVLPDRSAG